MRGGPKIGTDLPPGHFTFAGLHEKTGVSVSTLRRWRKDGKLDEVGTSVYGKLKVYIFNADSLRRIEELKRSAGTAIDK
jgi:predicted site-specific integrase-resolvase